METHRSPDTGLPDGIAWKDATHEQRLAALDYLLEAFPDNRKHFVTLVTHTTLEGQVLRTYFSNDGPFRNSVPKP